MPTKKNDIAKKAGAAVAVAPTHPKATPPAGLPQASPANIADAPPSPQPAQMANTPVTVPVDRQRSAVLAQLVAGGMSYAQAVAALDGNGGAQPAALPKVAVGKDPGADEVIDPDSIADPDEVLELVSVSHEPEDGYSMFESLCMMWNEIGRARDKKRFEISFVLDQRLFDWVVYATIQEAQFRRREDLTIADFLEIRIKELMAQDPTKGGRRDPSKSGPRELYNSAKGNWKPE